MSSTIIQVEQLSKRFIISHEGKERYTALRDVVSTKTKKLFTARANSNSQVTKEEFWALKDISFDIQQGDRVGIIGRNGAGKSTLLKILSRITEPTSGTLKIKGRIASLLEVGTGFHPELTGRENIFLNGAILGMSRSEIRKHFDAIVDFAEIENFLDTPVKRYSSGMYVRLAFAVAAHLEPEILIVDEVLAVGDAQFQAKCLGKMEDVSKGYGRTVLFVSHNMAAIRSLCNRGILLQNGMLKLDDNISKTIDGYEATVNNNDASSWVNSEAFSGEAYLESISVLDNEFANRKYFLNSEKVTIRMVVQTRRTTKNLKLGFDLIKNGVVVFRSQQVDDGAKDELDENVRVAFDCEIPANFLNIGTYYIKPLLSIHMLRGLTSVIESVASFIVNVDSSGNTYHTVLTENNHPGLIFPHLKWNLKNEGSI